MGFLPQQWEAWEASWKYRYVLFGGVRGPGKSYWLRWTLLSKLLYWFERDGLRDVRVGLFCETYPVLQDRQISRIEVEFPRWLGKVTTRETSGLGFYLREEYGGGVISLRNLDDPGKYVGAEFAALGVDQVEQVPKSTFDALRGSLRWPGIQNPPFLATANPGGVGHAWVKMLWIDREFPPEMQALAPEFYFVRAKPKSNPYLPQAYWDDLEALPDPLRIAWLEGSWDVFAGQAFSAWSYDRHVIEPFDIPAHWPKWRAIDHGYANPWCCLWLAKDPDTGRIFVYREAYQANLTDRQQAKLVVELSRMDTITGPTWADPSMWARKNVAGHVTSTADEYAAEGVPLLQADHDRLSGKRKVDRLLQALPDGKPGLQVFSTCKNLIRTLPMLVYDKNRVEDVDTKQEDHAYDALRYGMSQQLDTPKEPPLRPIPSPWERYSRSWF